MSLTLNIGQLACISSKIHLKIQYNDCLKSNFRQNETQNLSDSDYALQFFNLVLNKV